MKFMMKLLLGIGLLISLMIWLLGNSCLEVCGVFWCI